MTRGLSKVLTCPLHNTQNYTALTGRQYSQCRCYTLQGSEKYQVGLVCHYVSRTENFAYTG
jgi:hypothetical protein